MLERRTRARRRGLRIALGIWFALVLVATRPWSAPAERDARTVACADPGALDASLFLIGDAGAPRTPQEPLLDALAMRAGASVRTLGADRVAVVFLGDNVYPAGLRASDDGDRAEDERRLEAQLAAVRRSGARGILVPGNHDWANANDADGWEAVKRATRFVAARGASLLPPNGCPGPASEGLGARLELVFLDTQWWLQDGARPSDATSGCATNDEAAVERALAASLRAAGDREVVVLGHHPLRSGGPHGGVYGWKEHLFPLREWRRSLWIPLPVLGSIRPFARLLGASEQDIPSADNARMRASIERGLAARPPLLFAAGHDHSLQLLHGGASARFHIVSGAGSTPHLTWAYPIEGTLYAEAQPGWARLDAFTSGAVAVSFETLGDGGSVAESFGACLAPAR